MKLSRPAGSSDLEEARAIARRLIGAAQPRPNGDGLPVPPAPPAFVPSPREFRTEARPEPPPEPPPRTREIEPPPASLSSSTSATVDALVDNLVAEVVDDPLAVLTEADEVIEEVAPSWEEILERCQNLAQAQATLLLDADGEVVASYGDWPAAGVHAVAAKLIPLLEKKEESAPGVGLSVRLADRILTAWHFTLNVMPMTVAFLADVPIGRDARPELEDELRRGNL